MYDLEIGTAIGHRLEQRCADLGLRMNEKRRSILRALDDVQGHPDAEAIHKRAREIDPHLSIATVYRTLTILTEAGLLVRRAFGDGKIRYEETPEAHHDHLIIQETGAVIEFRSQEIMDLIHDTAAQHGFRLIGYNLELYGEKDTDFVGAAHISE